MSSASLIHLFSFKDVIIIFIVLHDQSDLFLLNASSL